MHIMWFRQDLRLTDNPALGAACKQGKILPIYIWDDVNPKNHLPGEASQWFLHHALESLNKSLDGKLNIFQGDPLKVIHSLIKKHNIQGIYWNRCYEPWQIARDKKIKAALDINVETFNGSLLWEPWVPLKSDGTPYKVFTPFYKKGCLQATPPRDPITKPRNIECHKDKEAISLNALALLPHISWDKTFKDIWDVSEQAAIKQLKSFIKDRVKDYKDERDIPSANATSRLSPYLHYGLISPNQAWVSAKGEGHGKGIECFCSELGWREFSYSLLYHNPTLPKKNLNEKFDAFPWINNKKLLTAWQKGMTGYPIVDAGMRELWQTGYMHNRVRMIVGSFLVKNLLIHWHEGEKWFSDCLVDADLASNSASWQWIAGCGADAAPYFRIFNPVLQGEKFDPEGEYVAKYVPELKPLPKKYIHQPWEAPEELKIDYPDPIVDLKASRNQALEAYAKIKG